jgi:hypothetical protein
MVTVPLTGVAPALNVVKAGTVFKPLAVKPILVVLFVQVYSVPVPVMLTGFVNTLLQYVTSVIGVTVGVGLTVIAKFCDGPGQVTALKRYCGVTVTVAVTGEVPVLMALNEEMFPVPVAESPMPVKLFVHV